MRDIFQPLTQATQLYFFEFPTYSFNLSGIIYLLIEFLDISILFVNFLL